MTKRITNGSCVVVAALLSVFALAAPHAMGTVMYTVLLVRILTNRLSPERSRFYPILQSPRAFSPNKKAIFHIHMETEKNTAIQMNKSFEPT